MWGPSEPARPLKACPIRQLRNIEHNMKRYRWARGGDINAFFGLMLDNVSVMVLLFSIISSTVPVEQPGKGETDPFHARLRADAHDPRHRLGRAAGRSGVHHARLPPGAPHRPRRCDGDAAGFGHAEHVWHRLPGAAAGAERGLFPRRRPRSRAGDGFRLARRAGDPSAVGDFQDRVRAAGQRGAATGAAGGTARLAGGDRPGADRLFAAGPGRHSGRAAGRYGGDDADLVDAGGPPRIARPLPRRAGRRAAGRGRLSGVSMDGRGQRSGPGSAARVKWERRRLAARRRWCRSTRDTRSPGGSACSSTL